uniref:Uncharacterized protein n=1 Tax=Arundo donax TaxID=35708 RepID=A0A0A8ZYH4_ARUDO
MRGMFALGDCDGIVWNSEPHIRTGPHRYKTMITSFK